MRIRFIWGLCLCCLLGCQQIKDTDSQEKITIQASHIIPNPFKVAPLVAIIRVGSPDLKPQDVQEITIKVMGKGEKGIDIQGTVYPQTEKFKQNFYDIATEKKFSDILITTADSVEIPVIGLYADHNNLVAFEIKTTSRNYIGKASIQTDSLPDEKLKVEIIKSAPSRMEPGDVTWLTASRYFYDFMFDHQGAVRHIINVEGPSDMRILKNHNLLIRNSWGETHFGEYSFLGEQVNTWQVPLGINHHDIYEMPSGNFLILISGENPYSREDRIIEIDRKSNEIVNYWDLFKMLGIDRLQAVWEGNKGNTPGGWFHMNSIIYDEQKDEILISGKRGGIMKLSRNGENGNVPNQNKQILWYMPGHDLYTSYINHNLSKPYILTALDAAGNPLKDQDVHHEAFHWPQNQHNPTILPSEDGLLHFLVFNNVYDENRSALVEYAVDEENKTVRQIWQYGKERADLYYPIWSGATWMPQTNNRLTIPATKVKPKVEVTSEGEVVFEFRVNSGGSFGGARWYRGGRIYLY